MVGQHDRQQVAVQRPGRRRHRRRSRRRSSASPSSSARSVTCTASRLASASTRLPNCVVSVVIRVLSARSRCRSSSPSGGTGPHEVLVVALDDADLLGGQPGVAVLVDRVDAGEQPGVEPDLVVVLGDPRRELLLEVPHPVVGHRAGEVREDVEHPLERAAGPLQRLEGVRERRLRRVVADRLDLGALLRDAGVEGRPVVLVPDPVEGRERERQVAGPQERVVVGHGVCSTRSRRRGVMVRAQHRRRA